MPARSWDHNSVCQSVRPYACFVIKSKNTVGYFDIVWKCNHSSFMTPTLVGSYVPFHLKFAVKVTHFVWKTPTQPRQLTKKSPTIESRPRTFQRAINEVRTLPLTPQRVAQRANLSVLWIKFKFSRIKYLQLQSFSVWKLPAAKL